MATIIGMSHQKHNVFLLMLKSLLEPTKTSRSEGKCISIDYMKFESELLAKYLGYWLHVGTAQSVPSIIINRIMV
jgi:hypothetical protein